ncbi:hypothetical protein Ahy_A07g031625 isoform C [Arachis hypogaea]|uniref:Uncharacterized protein n=1 Tax=Arachis hypogaea TaxID=3818 RepID=A0A445C4M2_ARAHY|nr:hypothetical protein Ahy_A07g031625 isoform C [Arachis hypogaea]
MAFHKNGTCEKNSLSGLEVNLRRVITSQQDQQKWRGKFQLLIFGDKPQYPERVYHSSVGTKKERKVSLHLQPCTSFEQIQAI